jgi:hypothetical protein
VICHVLFWAAVWMAVALVVGIAIGQCARKADFQIELARTPVPDHLPEEWISG